MSWDTDSPVFGRLPLRGYQDSSLVRSITTWPDEKLTALRDLLVGLYLRLLPATAPEDWLDFIASLVGWRYPVWDAKWTPAQKRAVLEEVAYLQANRGARGPVDKLLGILAPGAQTLSTEDSVLTFTLGEPLGQGDGRIFITLPLAQERNSPSWRNAERVRSHWLPCVCYSLVCYERFYLGGSLIGDPLLE